MEKGIFWGVILGAVILAMVMGCATLRSWNDTQERKTFVRGLKYHKDIKTGLCFAVLQTGHGGIAVVDKKHCERKSK